MTRVDGAATATDETEKAHYQGLIELLTPVIKSYCSDRGYEVFVLAHSSGHSRPSAEMKEVFEWIDAVTAGKKSKLATRRLDDDTKKR